VARASGGERRWRPGERWRHVRRVLSARPPLSRRDLAIDGGDLKALGTAAGPQFGD
jgi:hypothetical protein